ncbi:hypothetical protein DIE16_26395 [Burkholderia sp. Bp9090]|uniref:hypothetical protein n=1 Tax=Burkholderia sp. Bp9090 TaxID=2184567 RepID=UPI000F5E230D|nr:hypothetical protein [Burkholderia sp. Bp9090]RQZ31839.1 hypothetical protein DIE16_26395 [Burkholderia sp. Bp9090]
MSKTTIIATLGTLWNPAERLLASRRSGMTVARHLLFTRARAPLNGRAMTAFVGVRGARAHAKTPVFA